jgi:hypothetical protein
MKALLEELNGTRINTDEHGFILVKDLKTKDLMGHR